MSVINDLKDKIAKALNSRRKLRLVLILLVIIVLLASPLLLINNIISRLNDNEATDERGYYAAYDEYIDGNAGLTDAADVQESAITSIRLLDFEPHVILGESNMAQGRDLMFTEFMHNLHQPIGIEMYFPEEGIRFEIVSAAVYGYEVEFIYRLEDLIGYRFDERMYVRVIVDFFKGDHTGVLIATPHKSAILDHCGNTFILSQRFSLTEPPDDAVFYVAFQPISLQYGYKRAELNIGIDLSTLKQQEPYRILSGVPILRPHTHDIELKFRGFEPTDWALTITSIGIINELLHVQMRQQTLPQELQAPHGSIAGVFFNVIDPQGDWIADAVVYGSRSVRFKIDDTDNITELHQFLQTSQDTGFYLERVFEVDLAGLSEYSIYATAFFQGSLPLRQWTRFQLELSSPSAMVVAEHTDMPFGYFSVGLCCYATVDKIIITPMSLILYYIIYHETHCAADVSTVTHVFGNYPNLNVDIGDAIVRTYFAFSRVQHQSFDDAPPVSRAVFLFEEDYWYIDPTSVIAINIGENSVLIE